MNINRVIRSMKSKRFFIDLYSFMTIKLGYANTDLAVKIARHKVYTNLKKRYYDKLDNDYVYYSNEEFDRKIWICWLQGFDNAPDIVKECYKSIKRNSNGYEVVQITLENINDYINIPSYIIQKWEKGIISNTHLSDIIRLELLINHGGLWVDATVWCTGEIPSYIRDSELFVYREGWYDSEAINMGSWIISAHPNNYMLKQTLKLIYNYWEENNHMYDYFLFHLFFKMASEKYIEAWNKVPVLYQNDSHILQHEMFNKYDLEKYINISKLTPFHKLTVKFDEERANLEGTFYRYILNIDRGDD